MSIAWTFIKSITDGDQFEIDGLNIWDYEWNETGRVAEIKDPIYGQEYSFIEYEVNSGSKSARFAAGEFSNCIWGIYAEQEIRDAIYLKFKAPSENKSQTETNKIKELVLDSAKWLLKKIIPAANPDYEIKINSVLNWIVEFDLDSGIPNREIGINAAGKVIMTMPDARNYGYWTDNNLKLNDFKEVFETKKFSNKEFEFLWSNYAMNNK